MIALVKLLAELGLAVPDVLRMATLNAAIRLQRNDLGLVAAGRNADLVVFDNLTDLNPICVYSGGLRVARHGAILNPSEPVAGCQAPRDTMQIPCARWRSSSSGYPG